MTALPFPSGESVDLSAMPAVSSGCTTLADGSEGAQLHPELAEPPRPRFPAVSTARLLVLADELGALVALEKALDEPWVRWAEKVERQTVAELARRAI
jgi:hypothetical protein